MPANKPVSGAEAIKNLWERPVFQDTQAQDAVVRNLEVIGKTASHIPEEIHLHNLVGICT